jgi:DNA-binding NarL/FixJ family response regulator
MAERNEPKPVLVVDTEPLTRVAVMEALQSCGNGFTVEWAGDGRHAWSMLRRGTFSLLLVDAETPGLAIAEFARAAHSTSPGARVLVIGRSSATDLRDTAQRWKLDGYLAKPITVRAMMEVVSATRPRTGKAAPDISVAGDADVLPVAARGGSRSAEQQIGSGEVPAPIPVSTGHGILERLLSDTRARCVLLITAAGYPVDSVGQTFGLHLPTLGALIAATFAAAAELAKQLGNASDFRASHHQGPDCHIYTYEVTRDLLLATVFGDESQAGAVWIFAKRAAAVLGTQQFGESESVDLGSDLTTEVQAQLDSLFDATPTNGRR